MSCPRGRPGVVVLAIAALVALSACDVRLPSGLHWPEHWDPWPRPRHRETPREALQRQCRVLCDRFRTGCADCHTTAAAAEISQEDLKLTAMGKRAAVMRRSPTYGLGQDCGRCHQSGFRLNRLGRGLFVEERAGPAARPE